MNKNTLTETGSIHPRREELMRDSKLIHVVHKVWNGNIRWSLEKYSNGKIQLWRKRMGARDEVLHEVPLMLPPDIDIREIQWDFGYISEDGKGYAWLDFRPAGYDYNYPDEPELPSIGKTSVYIQED